MQASMAASYPTAIKIWLTFLVFFVYIKSSTMWSIASKNRKNFSYDMKRSLSLSTSGENFKLLDQALLLQGSVTEGYGRGSKKLGVPTANLPHFDAQISASGLERGVYCGWGAVRGDIQMTPVVANIGRSPTFVGEENAMNIIEAHLLQGAETKTMRKDFYGQSLRLFLVAFLRPEMRFASLDELKKQIEKDLSLTRSLTNEDIRSHECLIKARLQAETFINLSHTDDNILLTQYPDGLLIKNGVFWCRV